VTTAAINHFFALVVARQVEAFGQWPCCLREQLQGEARGQSFWAMDLDLLCGSFGPDDWQALAGAVQMSGTAPAVLSALTFAQAELGMAIPLRSWRNSRLFPALQVRRLLFGIGQLMQGRI
jgi:hypothetical protein